MEKMLQKKNKKLILISTETRNTRHVKDVKIFRFANPPKNANLKQRDDVTYVLVISF